MQGASKVLQHQTGKAAAFKPLAIKSCLVFIIQKNRSQIVTPAGLGVSVRGEDLFWCLWFVQKFIENQVKYLIVILCLLCIWNFRGRKVWGRIAKYHYNSNMWASVTTLQSRKHRSVPWKWKCHSHPMSVSELCLFLVLVGLWVWLLWVHVRRLINPNRGLHQIWVGNRETPCLRFRLHQEL